jgi:hypothetical protein
MSPLPWFLCSLLSAQAPAAPEASPPPAPTEAANVDGDETIVADDDTADVAAEDTADAAPSSDTATPVEPAPPAPPVAASAPTPTPAPPPQKCSMAVLDLEVAEGIPPARAALWTDAMVQEMQVNSGCTVLSRADIRAVISLEAEKSLLGCDQESCLAELGDALGVGELVTGRISRIEGSVLLSLRRTNLRTMVVTSRATDSFAGEDDEVFDFVLWLSRKLVSTDAAVVGNKPIPRPKEKAGPQLVERRGTIWGTLAWTGVALTATSAAVFGASAGVTAFYSNQLAQAKQSTENNRDFIAQAETVGPITASLANGALYAAGGLLVLTVPLFFLPHDELTRVDMSDVAAIKGDP